VQDLAACIVRACASSGEAQGPEDTTLAFSNNKQFAIVIPATSSHATFGKKKQLKACAALLDCQAAGSLSSTRFQISSCGILLP
jgi:hypothetical protein